MRFINFRREIKKYPIFNLNDLKVIFPKTNFVLLRKQLSQWSKSGQIIRLKNGVYLLSPEFLQEEVQPIFLASKIYYPSYISMEYVLSAYSLIPEAVFEITSVTTKSTRKFSTPIGRYSFQTLKRDYFFGFETRRKGNFVYYFAEKEKAVLDYLYLNLPTLIPDFITWKRLRFDNLTELNFTRLIKYAKKFKSKKLLLLILNLKKYAKSH